MGMLRQVVALHCTALHAAEGLPPAASHQPMWRWHTGGGVRWCMHAWVLLAALVAPWAGDATARPGTVCVGPRGVYRTSASCGCTSLTQSLTQSLTRLHLSLWRLTQ